MRIRCSNCGLVAVKTSGMSEDAELFETSRINMEESLKYSIDIGIVLEEMKYGLGKVH